MSGTGNALRIRGRDEQLQLVTGLLERVQTGVGGVAIVEGAAGLGKTRMLAAAHAAGMMTVMVPDLLAATDEMRERCIAIAESLHDVRRLLTIPTRRASAG